MAIIAITQHLGTRGVELGRVAAETLGYRFLTSDELIAKTSQAYKVTPEQLVIVDERRPHFWERLKTDTERFVAFFGRSVAHILPEHGCGLRVRLVGPMKDRVREVAAEEKLAPAIAERRVRDYDREVRARIQTLFGADIEDPISYGLMLNTFALPLNAAAAALVSCAEEIDRNVRPEQWREMLDAALSAEVRAALMLHPKIGHAPIEVLCASGAVQVNGPGLVPPWDDLVNDVVRRVEGVKSVEVIAEEQPVPVRPS